LNKLYISAVRTHIRWKRWLSN